MEDVIVGLLFLYFFVLRPILKQVRKGTAQSPESVARPRSPLRGVFEHLRSQLREAVEQAAAAQRSPPGGDTKTPWRGGEVARAGADLDAKLWDPETTAKPLGERAARELPGYRTAAAPVSPELPVTAEAVPAARFTRQPTYTGVELRQAVVWSEILGPPVSLRDG